MLLQEASEEEDDLEEVKDQQWQLSAKLEGVSWFDYMLLEPETKEVQLSQVTRSCLSASREQMRQLPPIDPSPFVLVDPARYCGNPAECHYSPCKFKHPDMPACTADMVRADGAVRKCGWSFIDEFRITPQGPTSTDLISRAGDCFWLGNRREAIREIMVAPKMHCTNSELVVHGLIWSVVDQLQDVLNADMITVNYGKWESANDIDKESIYTVDCHAHVHMCLSRAVVDDLSQKSFQDSGLTGIRGRVKHPQDHLEADCRDLENYRLFENKLRERVGGLETSVAALETSVADVKNSMKAMTDKMDLLLQRLDIVIPQRTQTN